MASQSNHLRGKHSWSRIRSKVLVGCMVKLLSSPTTKILSSTKDMIFKQCQVRVISFHVYRLISHFQRSERLKDGVPISNLIASFPPPGSPVLLLSYSSSSFQTPGKVTGPQLTALLALNCNSVFLQDSIAIACSCGTELQ